jgi:hypothetical protein
VLFSSHKSRHAARFRPLLISFSASRWQRSLVITFVSICFVFLFCRLCSFLTQDLPLTLQFLPLGCPGLHSVSADLFIRAWPMRHFSRVVFFLTSREQQANLPAPISFSAGGISFCFPSGSLLKLSDFCQCSRSLP